jgi:hypothetical protein
MLMLHNPGTAEVADAAARKQAKVLGWTDEQIEKYLTGPEVRIPPPQAQ